MDKKKRFLTPVLSLSLALATGFSLVACGGEAKPDDKKDPETPAAEQVTVSFDATTNGGVLSDSTKTTIKVDKGGKVTGAPTATKAATADHTYTFSGWYEAATGGAAVDFATATFSADKTLYAQFTEGAPQPPATEKVTITFDANTGTLTGDATAEIDKGGSVDAAKIPTAAKTDYSFTGWYTAATGGDKVTPDFDTFDESKTLYAHYAAIYTVTFDATTNGGTLTGEASVKVVDGGKIKNKDVPTAAKADHEFKGWYTAATGGDKVDPTTITVTENKTLYAQFGSLSMPLKVLKQGETPVGYRIEAEDSKIDAVLPSFNESFIEENIAEASGNKSVGALNGGPDSTLTFTFKAATAGKVTIMVRLAKSGGDQVITPADIKCTLNGTTLTFEGQTIRGGGDNNYHSYWDGVTVAAEVDINAGVNTFTYGTVDGAQGTDFSGSMIYSPAPLNIDCIDILTSVALTAADGSAASGEAALPVKNVYDKNVDVKLVIGAKPGGPVIEKALVTFEDEITVEEAAKLAVVVADAALAPKADGIALCDENGTVLEGNATKSRYIGYIYAGTQSPFTYANNVNRWSKLGAKLTSGLTIGEETYTELNAEKVTVEKVIPTIDDIWDVTGSFTEGTGDSAITLKYASYGTEDMKSDGKKNALIIWLHGAGEGGSDPTITLLGNQVTNLAQPVIQKYFTVAGGTKGAYVLAPQSPTMWMDNGTGAYITDYANATSKYSTALWNLIQSYVTANDDVDVNRIYIGGCSNGGFMTMHMIQNHPDYFAAAYPIATPYASSAALVAAIKDLPIWFTHSEDDSTVAICETQTQDFSGQTVETLKDPHVFEKKNTNDLYLELLKAGATNVHYSLFEKVTYNGENFQGHYSWVYTLLDLCVNVQPTEGAEGAELTVADLNSKATGKVQIDGQDVTLWGWLAAQAKTPASGNND